MSSKHYNCLVFEKDVAPILSLKWSKRKSPLIGDNAENDSEPEFDLVIPDATSLYQDSSIGYIGGFIVRSMLKHLSCKVCASALVQPARNVIHANSLLTLVKNNGGLYFPSDDVVKVLRICEFVFRSMVSGTDFRKPKITSEKNIKNKMVNLVMWDLMKKSVFASLLKHDIDHDFAMEDMHSSQLCRVIAVKYLDIRLYNHGKYFTETVIRKGNIGVRQQSNKLVQFKGL